MKALKSLDRLSLIYNEDIPASREKQSKEVLVEAGRRIMGETEIEGFLSKDTEVYLKICDPYVSKETLRFLEVIPKGITVQILTAYIKSQSQFERALELLRKNHDIHVLRVKSHDGRSPLHDRYILTKGQGWTIGASLKDVGRKDTVISAIENPNPFEKRYDSYWRENEIDLDGKKYTLEHL